MNKEKEIKSFIQDKIKLNSKFLKKKVYPQSERFEAENILCV